MKPQAHIRSQPAEGAHASRTISKIVSLTLGATLSVAWLSTIVVGMQSASTPAMRTMELPTVVIVGHKSAAVNATASSTSTTLAGKA